MKFTKEITKLEHSAAKLTVTVAKTDVEESYKSTLGKYVKQVQIPGFRKGHVPSNVLERKFGEQIKLEAAGELIDTVLNEIFQDDSEKENRPLPYAQPKMDEMPAFDTSKDFTFTVTYDVFPSVEIKDFNGISIKETQVTVGDDEVAEELKGLQERNAVVMDKKDDEAVEKDNIVTVDIAELGEDGKPVESTKRDGYTFTVGAEENLYKIDDKIIGMKKGEEKDLALTFPEDYAADLAGAKVTFHVKVNEIKQRVLPELNEEFLKDLNIPNVDTVEKLNKQIEEEILAEKNREIDNKFLDEVLKKATDEMTAEIEDEIYEEEVNRMYHEFVERMKMQGIDEELYFKYTNTKKEDLRKNMKEEATFRVRSRYLLESIAKAENISPTEEEALKEAESLAEKYQMTKEEIIKSFGGIEVLVFDLQMRKTLEFLKENN